MRMALRRSSLIAMTPHGVGIRTGLDQLQATMITTVRVQLPTTITSVGTLALLAVDITVMT